MNVIIVNDYSLVRKALSNLLDIEDDMCVIDEAAKISDAISKICSNTPDIALIHSRLSNESSFEIIAECKIRKAGTRFMVLAESANEQEFRQFLKCGVEGYMLMQSTPEELLYGLRLIHKGKRYYDAMVMDLMINDDNSFTELTPRELDVLIALGKGMNNKVIAQKLYITEFTVKKHVGQILSKLELRDRTEAALFANSKGISEYR